MKRVLPILLCLLALAVPRLYGQDHTVTFSAQPAEGGTVTASYLTSYEDPPVSLGSGETVKNGEYVNFTATPNAGYEVEKWEFNGTPDASAAGKSECSKTIDADMTVVVYFKQTAGQTATHTVTVSAEPASEKNYVAIKDYDTYGDIASGSAVEEGKLINVYAYCDKNKYKFDYWEVNGVRSDEYTTDKIRGYVVTEDVTFKAYFKELAMLPVTFSVNGPGTIVVKNSSGKVLTSGDKVLEGAYVKFVATPGENAELRDWTINGATDKAGKTKFSYKMDPSKPNTFVANFVSTATPQEYVVTFVADPVEGGTIKATNTATYKEIASGSSVAAGAPLDFEATANDGYEFEKWTVNGADTPGSITATEKLSITEITGETSVVAHFKSTAPAEKYAVTFASEPAGAGTVTATYYDSDLDEEVAFNSGAEFAADVWVTFNAKPEADYKVEKWLVNGTAIEMPSDPRVYVHKVNGALDVKVVFTTKPNEVTLKYSVATGEGGQIAVAVTPAGGGDAISVDSGSKVARGSSVTFTATPATGYEVDKWLVDGTTDILAGQKTTLTMTLEEDTEVQLFFKKEAKKCTVNFSADPVEGGTIKATYWEGFMKRSIEPGTKLPEGKSLTFTAEAKEGYKFEKFTVNGEDAPVDYTNEGQYATELSGDLNVVAHFKSTAPAKEYTVTFAADPKEGGTITATYYDNVNEKDVPFETGAKFSGDENYLTFTAKANDGYQIVSWSANGKDVTPSDPKKIDKLEYQAKEALDLKVVFKKVYPLTLTATKGGSLVAKVGDKEVKSGDKVAEGTKVTIEATPETGYELTALTAGTEDILAAKSFVMKGATEVKATFTKLQKNYVVTLKSNEHGTITIKEKVDLKAVPEGTKLTVVAKGANDKCELTKLTANGEDILKDKTFTVTKDTEVIAEFVDHTGIDAVAANAFVIYPNPASESATVTGLAPEAAVALYTLDGQLITRLATDRSGRLQIDLTALSDGTYLVVTEGATQRLVVKH